MKRLFISGMYKSGSTWLNHILNAHPDVVSAVEIDLVKIWLSELGGTRFEMKDHSELVEAFLTEWYGEPPSMWQRNNLSDLLSDCELLPDVHVAALPSELSGRLLYARALARTCRKALGEGFSSPLPVPLARLDTAIEALVDSHATLGRSGPVDVSDMELPSIISFVQLLKSSADLALVSRSFASLFAFLPNIQGHTNLCFKGADQIAVIEDFLRIFPNDRTLFIVRDGRDAAISAIKFEALMRKRDPAWTRSSNFDYWSRLQAWAGRIDMLMNQSAGTIAFIRYEDLLRRFRETVAAVYRWFGLDYDDELLVAVEGSTSFRAMTGRSRGQEADATIRRGISREWMEFLDDADKAKAWRLVSSQLDALGYTADGSLRAPRRGPTFLPGS